MEFSNLGIQLFGKNVFNLGFGDYNIETDEFCDTIKSMNGDPFRIFNTVLLTMSLFFKSNENSIILISGSDSTDEFEINCRKDCYRINCANNCKKRNQRIKIYCNFINKNFDTILNDYTIFGSNFNENLEISEFKKGKLYEVLLIYKK